MCDKEKWKKKKKEKGLSYNYDLNQISFIFKKKRKKEFQIHCFLFAAIKNIFLKNFPISIVYYELLQQKKRIDQKICRINRYKQNISLSTIFLQMLCIHIHAILQNFISV